MTGPEFLVLSLLFVRLLFIYAARRIKSSASRTVARFPGVRAVGEAFAAYHKTGRDRFVAGPAGFSHGNITIIVFIVYRRRFMYIYMLGYITVRGAVSDGVGARKPRERA